MFQFKKYSFSGPLIIFIFLAFYLFSCRNRQNPPKSMQEVAKAEIDTNSLFDGKSLQGWEITNFGSQGPVYVSGGEIILGMGDGCTGITWKKDFPTINYEVTLDAKRMDGIDFFCGMTFPVKKDPCTLIIGGWAGTTVGLSNIDGADASENSTTSLLKFDKNRWYHISLSVTEASIKAMIDSIKVINFNIDGHKLSVRPEVELSRPFGIASWNTTAALKNIRVKRIYK
jgi:hypothetical protein